MTSVAGSDPARRSGRLAGRSLGHYRILRPLGRGGMGEVYVAEDDRLGRRVALKVLPPELAAEPERMLRFEQEARTLAALDHPGIVTVFAVEEAEGLRFFTMELVDGSSLDRVIPPEGFEPGRFFDVAAPLVEALGAAHARGVIHRDLKPANVMLAKDGRIKVLDFGLATLATLPEAGGPPERETATDPRAGLGAPPGTLQYMAPELLAGRPGDRRSDVFSLGVLLYEMASGARPFAGDSAPELVSAILRDPARPLADVAPRYPHGVGALLAACLEKDPSRRPSAMAEIRSALERARSEPSQREARPIAVLPFADMSPERDQDYLCEGLAEELIGTLQQIKGLRVASRIASFRFGPGGHEPAEVGRRLGVEAILEGSVRKAGDRLRITVSLVDARSGFDLWSQRWDRRLEDVFQVQEEIARRIADTLQVGLSQSELRALERQPTRDPDAWDAYLRGRQRYNDYDRAGVEEALRLFARATERDPAFAMAWAGFADCCSYLFANAGRGVAHLTRAAEASQRALDLAPALAEAHLARGVALSLAERADEADVAFETAMRLDPRRFEHHYFFARHCFTLGRLERAARLYESAWRLRPEDFQALLLAAQIHDDLGRPREAAEARRRGVAAALDHLETAPRDMRALYMAANGLVALGESARGLELAARARELGPTDPMSLYNLACVYSLAGSAAEALDCLAAAIEHGFSNREWLAHDSNLDAVRGEPRFAEIVRPLSS